ncbi:MAG: aspartate/glutamate racemase family protein [Thalassobaculales bacterium]
MSTTECNPPGEPRAAGAVRLLLVNGNTSEAVTGRIADAARAVANPATELVAVTAAFGARYILSRAEAAIAGHAALQAIAAAPPGIDAAVIACFGEPGLLAAREVAPFPVTGMAEAAMLTACQVARRFILLTGGGRWPAMLEELVAVYGLKERCAAIAALPTGGQDLMRDPAAAVDALADLAARTLSRTDADAVILGGAALIDLLPPVSRRLAVPVIDPLAAAILQAEALVRLGARRPPPPPTAGLSGVDPRLSSLFGKGVSR